jgi:hypothetical protein
MAGFAVAAAILEDAIETFTTFAGDALLAPGAMTAVAPGSAGSEPRSPSSSDPLSAVQIIGTGYQVCRLPLSILIFREL